MSFSEIFSINLINHTGLATLVKKAVNSSDILPIVLRKMIKALR